MNAGLVRDPMTDQQNRAPNAKRFADGVVHMTTAREESSDDGEVITLAAP
jgi:hypothetical protein